MLYEVITVRNPYGGVIRADTIGEVILDPAVIDPTKTEIITGYKAAALLMAG